MRESLIKSRTKGKRGWMSGQNKESTGPTHKRRSKMNKQTLFILSLLASIGLLLAGCTTPTFPDDAVGWLEFVAYVINEEGTLQAPLTPPEPVIILVPVSGEVPLDEVDLKLAITMLNLMEGSDNLSYTDEAGTSATLYMSRPDIHRILIIDRSSGVPPTLIQRGEITLNFPNDNGQHEVVSIINYAGPNMGFAGPEYSRTWSLIQAICLGYTFENDYSDPMCNIFSASAAAGWLHLPEEEVRPWVDGLGPTQLDIGVDAGQDLIYGFIPEVYQRFAELNQ